MSADDQDRDKDRRIADLESEVAALRARLAPEETSQADECAEDDEEQARLVPPSNRARQVTVSVLLVLLTLGVMFAIFQAISSGIDSVAPRAANFFTGDEAPATNKTKAPAAPKGGERPSKDVPRAPGL